MVTLETEKQWLKETAEIIRKTKRDRRTIMRERPDSYVSWSSWSESHSDKDRQDFQNWMVEVNQVMRVLALLRSDFRHRHIAYCLVRGRTMGEIEKPARGHPCCMSKVQELVESYATICPSKD